MLTKQPLATTTTTVLPAFGLAVVAVRVDRRPPGRVDEQLRGFEDGLRPRSRRPCRELVPRAAEDNQAAQPARNAHHLGVHTHHRGWSVQSGIARVCVFFKVYGFKGLELYAPASPSHGMQQ